MQARIWKLNDWVRNPDATLCQIKRTQPSLQGPLFVIDCGDRVVTATQKYFEQNKWELQ